MNITLPTVQQFKSVTTGSSLTTSSLHGSSKITARWSKSGTMPMPKTLDMDVGDQYLVSVRKGGSYRISDPQSVVTISATLTNGRIVDITDEATISWMNKDGTGWETSPTTSP